MIFSKAIFSFALVSFLAIGCKDKTTTASNNEQKATSSKEIAVAVSDPVIGSDIHKHPMAFAFEDILLQELILLELRKKSFGGTRWRIAHVSKSMPLKKPDATENDDE